MLKWRVGFKCTYDMKYRNIIKNILIPEILKKIMDDEKLDDVSALYKFYLSNTYELLSKEKSKLWKLTSEELYLMYKMEDSFDG